MKHLFLFLNLIMFLPQLVHADGPEVMAVVNRNQVGPGDVINLTISVTTPNSVPVEEPKLPAMQGFELINATAGMETRSSYTNGQFVTTQSRNFTYMLHVAQKGILTIPGIPVVVEGKTYVTKPIKISATNSRAAPPQAQNDQADPYGQMDEMEEIFNQMLQRRLAPHAGGIPPRGQGQGHVPGNGAEINPEEAFFILGETDKTKAYVGEQITASFYLYTRGQIRDIDTLKYPDLKGFWKEEIEMASRLNFEGTVINGIPYQRALLVSYALFPIKAGKSIVDSYKAKCTVLSQSNFGFGKTYIYTKTSKPINIEVVDVPSQGRPANFSGAVGRFRVSAHFEPPTGVVNQPVTLRVRFEGQGNAKLIELPKMELPPSFELYDQKSQAKYLKDGTSFKEFEVMILPREPGVFTIPAIASSVFDPQTGKFTTISSQPLSLSVTGTATTPGQQPIPGAPAQVNPAASGPKEATLPGLATEIEDEPPSTGVLAGVTGGIFALVFAFLAYSAWIFLRRKPKRVSLGLVLKRRLKSINDLVDKGEWRRVGVELTNAVYYVLGQISDQGGSNVELSRMLEHTSPSLRNELSEPIQKLLAQCEALSFAPEKMIGDLSQKNKLEILVKEFESVMKRAIDLAEI